MKNAPTAVMGIPHSHIATKSVRKQNALSPPDFKMPLIIIMLIIFRLTAILSIVIAGLRLAKIVLSPLPISVKAKVVVKAKQQMK